MSVQFSPDGQWVVTASHDFTARVWDARTSEPLEVREMLWMPVPVPPWLPELAEAVWQKRIDTRRIIESVPEEELLRLRAVLEQGTSLDLYSRWAKWFFADRSQRTISPFSTVTVPEYIQRRIKENTPESLHEAILHDPTNGLAFARLARKTLAQDAKDNPRRIGEADFFSRRAVELSPNDSEVQRVRAEIAEQVKSAPKP